MNRFFVTAMCCLSVSFAAGMSVHSEELTGEAILKRSEDAKHHFHSYTDVSKGDGFVANLIYYVKYLPKGCLSWSERATVMTGFPDKEPERKITITNGYDKQYWYYPNSNVAADISYQMESIQKSADAEEKSKEGTTVNFEPVAEIQYDGHDCYDIKTTTVKEGKTIAEDHYLIDKKSFLPRLHEGLENERTFRYEYKNIRPEPEMTDDFFRLPDGVEIKTATNHEEFTAVLKEIDAIRHPPPPPVPFQHSPEHLANVKKAEAYLNRTPEEKQKERDEIIRESKAIAAAAYEKVINERKAKGLPVPDRDPAEIGTKREPFPIKVKPFWTARKFVAVIGNAVLLSLVIYFLWRKRTKK